MGEDNAVISSGLNYSLQIKPANYGPTRHLACVFGEHASWPTKAEVWILKTLELHAYSENFRLRRSRKHPRMSDPNGRNAGSNARPVAAKWL